MSGNVLMAAMGNINDRYIMEFAEVKPIKKHHSALLTKILPLAACLCVVIMSAILLTQNGNAPQGNQSGDLANNVIWGNGVSDNVVEEYGDKAAKGTIILAESLENALKNSDNEDDLFAVMVTEMTGAAPNDVYNTFVKPLNVNEKYLETGIIFISEEQIAELECPSDLSLVLSLAIKPYEDQPVNQETLDTTVSEKIKVKVYLKCNVDDLLSQYQEQLSGLSGEEYQQMRQSIIKAEISQMVSKFLADYEITAESVSETGIYIPKFTAELNTTLISQIIEDGRVELVLEETDTPGMDQAQ